MPKSNAGCCQEPFLLGTWADTLVFYQKEILNRDLNEAVGLFHSFLVRPQVTASAYNVMN